MTETTHIFDEFPGPSFELSAEQRNRKRFSLEPLVFDILKAKYGAKFRENWLSYKKPQGSNRCVVIFEGRIHPNLEFILHNAAYYAKGWNIAIYCSDTNYQYIREILGEKRSEVFVYNWFEGGQTRDVARREYNDLLRSAEFYESFPWEHILTMEMDSYLRRPIPEEILNYDFVAATTGWDADLLCGGVSYKRRQAMLDICRLCCNTIAVWEQDMFLFLGAKELGYKIPGHAEAKRFIGESCYTDEVFTVHQWWTFWFEDGEKSMREFHAMLTCCDT